MVVFQVFENAEYFTTLLRQFKNNCFHPGIGFVLIPVKTIFIIVFLAEVLLFSLLMILPNEKIVNIGNPIVSSL